MYVIQVIIRAKEKNKEGQWAYRMLVCVVCVRACVHGRYY